MIRPSFQVVGIAALLPLAAACCFAVYLALTKKTAGADDALVMQLWAGLSGASILAIALFFRRAGVDCRDRSRLAKRP